MEQYYTNDREFIAESMNLFDECDRLKKLERGVPCYPDESEREFALRNSRGIAECRTSIEKMEKTVRAKLNGAATAGIKLRFQQIIDEHLLNSSERKIVMILLYAYLRNSDYFKCRCIFTLVEEKVEDIVEFRRIMMGLCRNGIIEGDYRMNPSFIEMHFHLSNKTANFLLDGETHENNGRTEYFVNELDIQIPEEIVKRLNEKIIGQERAKKVLATAVYNHYKRLIKNRREGRMVIDKSNIMLIGPTGSGKTLICKTLGEILNVPVAVCDATGITAQGYVGDDACQVI